MLLTQKIHTFTPAEFNLTGSTILGTNPRWKIDRTWPLEGILVMVNFAVTTTAFTTVAATAGNMATPDQWENILNIVSKINLTVNDGIRPSRSVIDCSGIRLLEYNAQTNMNLNRETLRLLQYAYQHGAAALPIGTYQLAYYIPMVDSIVAEPLRTRMYLPVHKHKQDPVLTLQFNTLANMGMTVGTMANIAVDVALIRREVTDASENYLITTKLGTNPYGYIDWDLIEQPFVMPLGSGAEYRAKLAIPGSYLNLLMTQYRGGDPLTKEVIDTNIGDTIAHSLGNEGIWRLESSLVTLRNWRWKYLRTLNDMSRPLNNLTTNAAAAAIPALGNISPDFSNGNATTATAFFASPSCTMLDFLSDSVSGNAGNELGSVLDTNVTSNSNLQMELIGTPAAVATNPSYLQVMGRRLIGDVSGWQKF